MLRIFRSIRQSLINREGLRRYLYYALGEIALVMIGILLALQVNNWNEMRKQNSVLASFLNNLKENLQDDIEQLTGNHESSQFRYYATQYLLRISGNPEYDASKDEHIVYDWTPNRIWNKSIPEQYNVDFIQKAFLWTHRIGMTKANTSTVEELRSTGMYSALAQDLKKSLYEYYEDFEFRYGSFSNQLSSKIIIDWRDSLGKEGVTNSDPFKFGDPIQLLINHPERVYLLTVIAGEASWHAQSSKILIEKAMELIGLIDGYIRN